MPTDITAHPLISIVTVVYNGVHTLERTIQSVLRQTYTNIEYIIIDGGSTDGTLDIINKYNDRIAYWISEPDNGIYDAMNKAVQHTSGDWVFFLGADDILYNIIHEIAPRFRNKNTIYYGNVHFGSTSKIYNGRYNQYKLSIANICHQSLFYPAHVFKRYKYDLNYPIFADYALNLQCWADDQFTFEYLPVIVSFFAPNGMSSTQGQNKDWKFEQDKMHLIRKRLSFNAYIYAMAVKYAVMLRHRITHQNRPNITT